MDRMTEMRCRGHNADANFVFTFTKPHMSQTNCIQMSLVIAQGLLSLHDQVDVDVDGIEEAYVEAVRQIDFSVKSPQGRSHLSMLRAAKMCCIDALKPLPGTSSTPQPATEQSPPSSPVALADAATEPPPPSPLPEPAIHTPIATDLPPISTLELPPADKPKLAATQEQVSSLMDQLAEVQKSVRDMHV